MTAWADAEGRLDPPGVDLWRLVAAAGGTPCFVYDTAAIRRRVAALRAALPASLALRYAVKANPMPAVVHEFAGLVDGFDVASAGEMRVALNACRAPARVAFAGPGKTDAELRAAVAAGTLVEAESAAEVARLKLIAEGLGVSARLALRVNPGIAVRGSGLRMAGASPFGMMPDAAREVLAHHLAPPLNYEGLHCFFGSQIRDPDVLRHAFTTVAEVVERVAEAGPAPPEHVNLGGGFGIPYASGESPLDLGRVADALSPVVARLQALWPRATQAIELGRFLVGEAGVYLTTVVDRKTADGETFVVTDGGLHHVLAATGNFGQRIRRPWPVAVATRRPDAPLEAQTIVGCNCTPLDRLASEANLPRVEPGDLVAVFQTGAYGASASPVGFLSHPLPAEVLL